MVSAKTDITPMTSVSLAANNTLTVTGSCGEAVETKVFNYTITDPTGNTDPTTYAVTLHCIGPKMTVAPQPLTLSANVGETASGTFTIQNTSDTASDGSRPSLNYSLTPTTVSASADKPSSLAGGDTATVTVKYVCTAAGPFTGTVNVSSSSVGVAGQTVGVTGECKQPQRVFVGRVSGVWGFISGYELSKLLFKLLC